MDCYKHFFIRFFENSSDELGTGNTRHFRKSIINDESDERELNHCPHLESGLVPSPSLLQKHSLTGVTSIEV